jgi:hypothetical protein
MREGEDRRRNEMLKAADDFTWGVALAGGPPPPSPRAGWTATPETRSKERGSKSMLTEPASAEGDLTQPLDEELH